MRFAVAVDAFLSDYESEGRINSAHTRLAYRTKLDHLGIVVENRDPAKVGLPEHTPEAEAVLILREGDQITLVLDDGERLEFDASELQHAVEGP